MAQNDDDLSPNLDRNAPEKVAPIIIGGVRYVCPWGSRGEFRAVDDKSGKQLWSLVLYRISYDKKMEKDAQDVFVRSMKKQSDESILVEDEEFRVYQVDLVRRSSRIGIWPVQLQLSGLKPLSVEISLRNSLDRPISFDEPSVAVGGRLENNLFKVKADGKDVPYRGMMKKRMPPDSYLVLKPQGAYRQVVDLSPNYAVPDGTKSLEIVFSHHNHFSKDDFDLLSRPLIIDIPHP